MRAGSWILPLLLLAACGNKESGTGTGTGTGTGSVTEHGAQHPEWPPDAAPWKPTVGGLAGVIPAAKRDLPPVAGAAPLVAVIIDADGALAVAPTGGSWQKVAAPGFLDQAKAVATPEELPAALLAILAGSGEPAAALAATMSEERTGADEAEVDLGRGGGAQEVEIAFTYAAAEGVPPSLATPLLIIHPDVPAEDVVEVVERVGGIFAIADGEELAVLPTVFPWENGAWGGADLGEDERPSVDVLLDANRIGFFDAAARDYDRVIGIEPPADGLAAELKTRLQGAAPEPESVVDALVAKGGTAQGVVSALDALDAAGAPRVGIATSPWPLKERAGRRGAPR